MVKYIFVTLFLMSSSVFAKSDKHMCWTDFDTEFAKFGLESMRHHENELSPRFRKEKRKYELILQADEGLKKLREVERKLAAATDEDEKRELGIEKDAANATMVAACARLAELDADK